MSCKDFTTLSPEEQDRLMKEYIMELPEEDLRILKKMIENEENERINCKSTRRNG